MRGQEGAAAGIPPGVPDDDRSAGDRDRHARRPSFHVGIEIFNEPDIRLKFVHDADVILPTGV